MGIPANDLLAIFQQMNREHWAYEWGAAQKGKVDCSGAFVYAFRQFGKSIYQGSNRIARTEIVQMLPISEAKPGMAAFKKRDPGMSNYNLPSSYNKGGQYYNGDLSDFYHIGLVDENTNYVLNAQSAKTGFVSSPITQNWIGVGYLKKVDYNNKESKPMYQVVYGALRLRKEPGVGNNVILSIPNGSYVDLIRKETPLWAYVQYKGEKGYVDVQFLEPVGDAEPLKPAPGSSEEEAWNALEAAFQAYKEARTK